MSLGRKYGEKPHYTKSDTARYFSQSLRWQRGAMIHYDQVLQLNPNVTQYLFRTQRSIDGFHRVTRTRKAGQLDQGGGSSTPGFDPTCPFGCLTNALQYVRFHAEIQSIRWDQVLWSDATEDTNPNDANILFGWILEDDPVIIDRWYRAPYRIHNPPSDGVPVYSMQYSPSLIPQINPECSYELIQRQYTAGTATYQEVYYVVTGREEPWLVASWLASDPAANGPPSSGMIFDSFESVPHYGGGTGAELYGPSSGSAYLVYYFADADGNLTSQRCDFNSGDDGGEDPPPPPTFEYVCSCPDYTQQQSRLPNSRWRSEHIERSWAGTHTHSGTCKHIYSVRFDTGDPLPDPNTVPRYVEGNPLEIIFDWDLPPVIGGNGGDWDYKQSRAWRDRMIAKHKAEWAAFWDMVNKNPQLRDYLNIQKQFFDYLGLSYSEGMTSEQKAILKQIRAEVGFKDLWAADYAFGDLRSEWGQEWAAAREANQVKDATMINFSEMELNRAAIQQVYQNALAKGYGASVHLTNSQLWLPQQSIDWSLYQ